VQNGISAGPTHPSGKRRVCFDEDPVEEEELNFFDIVLRSIVSGEALLVSYLKKIISIFFRSGKNHSIIYLFIFVKVGRPLKQMNARILPSLFQLNRLVFRGVL
jgi:hypothetical protein